jgi:uncharacterized protein YdcH (DUF465 family)
MRQSVFNAVHLTSLQPASSAGGSAMTYVDKHPLAADFPELRDRIHTLKTSSAHFARQLSEYEALDREVIRIEEGIEHRSDEALEHLKMRRGRLKDELYAMLTAP